MNRLLIGCFLGLLSGCTVGPNYHPPKTESPKSWSAIKFGNRVAIDETSEKQLERWWTIFGDQELNRLVDRAIAQNLDVKVADLRILEARAGLSYVKAGFFPSVSAGIDADREHLSSNDAYPPVGGVYNTFQAGFDASWELDLFGQTRREYEAAKDTIDAQEDQRHGTLVTLLGDLGNDYITLRAAQERLRIAQRNLAVEQQILEFTRERNDQGLASQLDVSEADAQVQTLQSLLPGFQATIAQEEYGIADLLGEQPDALQDELQQSDPGSQDGIPAPPPRLPAEIPSEVVRNRPDIRAAERNLASATATIGVAEAEYFPKFSIDPSIDVSAGFLHKLLDVGSLAWTVPASIQMPIFDAGKIAAEVSLAKTYAAVELIDYQKTVLAAFRDVETAIAGYQADASAYQSLVGAAQSDQTALDRSTDLYKNGLGDFISVLDNERALYAAQDQIAQSQLATSSQTIALYKALGSGWQTIPEPVSVKP